MNPRACASCVRNDPAAQWESPLRYSPGAISNGTRAFPMPRAAGPFEAEGRREEDAWWIRSDASF